MASDAPAALGQVWAEHRVPLMAALTAKLGSLERAEDALSEAALRAHRTWAAAMPANPSGWLYRVALNAGRDQLRRMGTRQDSEDHVKTHIIQPQDDALSVSPEARLQLFARCTDPRLSPDQQIALMLFHLAGMNCAAIARAFLVREATIHQRLSRARSKLTTREDPPEPDLTAIRSALEIIYLQSYRDVAGGVDADALGRDALQLSEALCDATPDDAESWALLGVLSALEARRHARTDAQGQFVPFSEQDSAHWSVGPLRVAGRALQRAARLVDQPGPYTVRAQIELTRMRAVREGDNRDRELLSLHDMLIGLTDAPFARIERALILARLDGPSTALASLDALEVDLSGHAGWHLAKAELHAASGDRAQARLHLNAASKLVDGEAERAFIATKRDRLSS